MRLYARYAWGVLAYNLLVIAWGAYVRATGSGAGCGGSWPTCRGDLVPTSPGTATLIEYSHRLSSGLSLLLVGGLVVFAFRVFGAGHPARRGAVMSGCFLILEAILGAGLVAFGLVAHDSSLARGFVMPVHLVNTFLLLASLALTAYWASGGADFSWRGQGALGALLGVGVVAMIVLGVSGAVTALGDTLFPVASLGEGLAQDLSPAAHLFIRLRILHPVIAAAVGSYLVAVGIVAGLSRPARSVRVLGAVLVFVFSLQVAAGVVNLVLLAPVPLQLVHLLLADLTWIALVLLTATTFAQAPRRAAIASDPACATSSAVRV